VVVRINSLRLQISHISETIITPHYKSSQVHLQYVYHVLGIKKKLLSIAQLTSIGYYILFGPSDVKVYRNLKILERTNYRGMMYEVCLYNISRDCICQQNKNEIIDLWHIRLTHVSYPELSIMIKELSLKGLPQPDVKTDIVYIGCQYGKAH
jgi:hypothetical protein